MNKNKIFFSTKHLPTWFRALLMAAFTLTLITWGAEATTVSKTNSTDGSADDNLYTPLARTVTFVEDVDFVAGSAVQHVSLSVDFEKISGTCPTHDGGDAWNSEIFMRLRSPSSTEIALIRTVPNPTYTGKAYSEPVTVVFDDWASTTVGGAVPESGTFRPVEPLSIFNGETPLGDWTLYVGDSAAGDPLCFYEYTLTIDAAQPPVVNDQTFSVAEQSANGTSVGTVVATDSDAGDKLTYTITAGNDGNVFAINKLTGEITVVDGSQLDFETTPSYVLTVQVTDSSGLFDTATITINVINANEAPTDINLDNDTVAENQLPGTAVGSFSTTDPNGGSHIYTLVDGDGAAGNASFQIAGDELQTVDTFDYETGSSYSIRVRSTDDGGLWFEKVFTITIIDANELPTDISLDNSSVLEHRPAGTLVGNFSTTDPDVGDSHSYSLVSGAGGADNASFSISGDQLLTAAPFDFETKPSYSIRVRTTDNGGLWFEKVFTITIEDGNDPPTDIALDNDTVAENELVAVGNFSTTDPNGGSHSYTLVAGDGASGNSYFQIVGDELQTIVVLDYEAGGSYSIRVRSTDDGGLWFEKIFTITVTDANDAPTDISLDNSSVAENQPSGTLVGNFSTTDQDSGDSHTYVLTDTVNYPDNISFAIGGINGDQLQTAATFDRETKSSYSIRVQTDDGNGGKFAKVFTITITNVNEDPTDITLSSSSVAENQPSGTLVGNLSTTDPDSGDSFTYFLVSTGSYPDNLAFQISGSQLQTADTFDYETKDIYLIRIQTRDSGGLTFEKEFTITITDVNDPPVAVDDEVTTDEDTVLIVAAPGVLANDIDEDGDTLTVLSADSTSAQGASVSVAANGGFTYDPTAVTALQALNVGENVADTFTYMVRDGGLVFDPAIVTVTVTGVNDAPVANDDAVTTLLETAVIVSPMANDTDIDTTDTMSIASFTQGAHGAVTDNGNGTLTYTPATGYIGSDSFTYTIEDSHGATDTATVNVTINPQTYYVYLPMVLNNYASAPDLVITSLQASSDYVEVAIENQGNQATSSGFWVDFYVNPIPPPMAANELWPNLSSEGIAWGVTTAIAPGQVLTLTYSTAPGATNLYYSAADSSFSGSLPAGTPIYAQVDSAHVGHVNGAIEEIHEITGGAYNNIFQASATAVSPPNSLSNVTVASASTAVLPRRH